MQDLNDLVKLEDGWVIEEGNDINDEGQITAIAKRGGKHLSLIHI